jgi:hypothetical protein
MTEHIRNLAKSLKIIVHAAGWDRVVIFADKYV